MMAVCACGTGLFQLLPKATALSTSLASQPRPERTSQCTVSLPPFKCDCNSGYGGSRGVLVRSSSLEKFGKTISCRRGRSRLDKNFGSLDRKPIVEVQARVQDTVEHETYDRESGFEHKFRRKDPIS